MRGTRPPEHSVEHKGARDTRSRAMREAELTEKRGRTENEQVREVEWGGGEEGKKTWPEGRSQEKRRRERKREGEREKLKKKRKRRERENEEKKEKIKRK